VAVEFAKTLVISEATFAPLELGTVGEVVGVGVGVGEVEGVGVGVGVGEVEGVGVGVGVGAGSTGFNLAPLSQINFFPLFMHVYFFPLKTLDVFSFVQVDPDLGLLAHVAWTPDPSNATIKVMENTTRAFMTKD
jgi:hypothetical protein